MITVVGLGKIGLPLATQFATKGYQVFGVDINIEVVNKVNSGIAPFPGEDKLDKNLKEVIEAEKLRATNDFEFAISNSKYVVVVVPLYVNEEGIPDFESLDRATESIGNSLKKGTLVSFETTLPVGTTRNRLTPILEKCSTLVAGTDFHVVFSPERVFSGRVFEDLRRYPKLVGGIDDKSTDIGYDFYSQVLDFDKRVDLTKKNGVWKLKSCEAAEFAKLAETTYRDVNIALANQFAIFAENEELDIEEIIEASNSQPFSHIHRPGIAVGGHCIPVYPKMYLLGDPNASIVKVARELNEGMPAKLVETLHKIHGELKEQKVVILGVAYRGGVKESAFSGVFPISKALEEYGANVYVHDPLYSDTEIISLGLKPYNLGENIDAVILHSNHEEYKTLQKVNFPGLKTIIDGRGELKNLYFEGVRVHVIGKG